MNYFVYGGVLRRNENMCNKKKLTKKWNFLLGYIIFFWWVMTWANCSFSGVFYIASWKIIPSVSCLIMNFYQAGSVTVYYCHYPQNKINKNNDFHYSSIIKSFTIRQKWIYSKNSSHANTNCIKKEKLSLSPFLKRKQLLAIAQASLSSTGCLLSLLGVPFGFPAFGLIDVMDFKNKMGLSNKKKSVCSLETRIHWYRRE